MPSKQIFKRVKIAPARNTFVNRKVHSLTHEAPHSLLNMASKETRRTKTLRATYDLFVSLVDLIFAVVV